MAVKVNLLPENYTAKKGVALISRWIKTATLVSLVISIFSAIGLLAFFLIRSSELKNLQRNLTTLEGELSALNTSEQKLVLLKDRLEKIKAVKSLTSANESLDTIEPVINLLPQDASVSEISVDTQKIDASFIFRDTVALSAFLDNLESSGSFSAITLTSFGYTSQAGYLVGLRFTI